MSRPLDIVLVRASDNNADFRELVRQLDAELLAIFGFSTQAYLGQFNSISEADTILVAYAGHAAVGCGCLRKRDAQTGEIKRMFVTPSARSMGVGRVILSGLEKCAQELGFEKVVLETGAPLQAATHLYKKHGYVLTENYGPYVGVDSSICMAKSVPRLSYHIENTSEADLELIFWMFEEAMRYHERKGYPVWKSYDRDVLTAEERGKAQYKIVIEGQVALVFSVVYADKLIWRERENGQALYLHRIVVNPAFKGRQLFGAALAWAKQHAQEKGVRYLRMDTWGDNPNMIRYYADYGFRFIENYTTPNTPELPIPHRDLFLALLELDLQAVTQTTSFVT